MEQASSEVPIKFIDGTIDNGCDSMISKVESYNDGGHAGDTGEGAHIKQLQLVCGAWSQIDNSAGLLVDHLKATQQWQSTLFLFLTSNTGCEGSSGQHQQGYTESNIRASAFMSGGYLEHTLSATRKLPFRYLHTYMYIFMHCVNHILNSAPPPPSFSFLLDIYIG